MSSMASPGWDGHLDRSRLALYSDMAQLLMILFQIHPEGVGSTELERDAPRPIHMNRIPLRLAPKWMEIVSGPVHFLGRRHAVERIKTDANASVHAGIYLWRLTAFEKFSECLVFEGLYHRMGIPT
jgi:hypothetical protein